MADIAMCTDEKCVKKLSCYRYTADKNMFWQAYFMKSPRNTETGECPEFLDNFK